MVAHPATSSPLLQSDIPEVAARPKTLQDTGNTAELDAMCPNTAEGRHTIDGVGVHGQGRAAARRAHDVCFGPMCRGVPQTLAAVLPGRVPLIVARWAAGAYRPRPGEWRPASRNRRTLATVAAMPGLPLRHAATVEVDPMAAPHAPALR